MSSSGTSCPEMDLSPLPFPSSSKVGWNPSQPFSDLDQTLLVLGEDHRTIEGTTGLGAGLCPSPLEYPFCFPHPNLHFNLTTLGDLWETNPPVLVGGRRALSHPSTPKWAWSPPWASIGKVVLAITGDSGLTECLITARASTMSSTYVP